MFELLELTDSRELQGWQALWRVKAEEAKQQRDAAESQDGQVFDVRDNQDDDEDDDEGGDDGE